MKVVRIFSWGLVLWLVGPVMAQNDHRKHTDSLIREVGQASEEDTAKVNALYKIARQLRTTQPDSAYQYALHALTLARKLDHRQGMASGYYFLAGVYARQGAYQDALRYHRLYEQIKDTAYKEEIAKTMEELEARYETSKKEQQIRLLNKEKEIKEVALHQQQLIRNALAVGVVFLFLVAFLLFNRYRTKKQHNELLAEKNQKITESINYAKRIQDAILPDQKLAKKYFKDAFIFYKPRDIVSGDFYWLAEKDGQFIIAAVDCTGHGVPGAFMSMMGNTLLNEIIHEKNLTQPNDILDQLDKSVKVAFQKRQNGQPSQEDGMSISVCSFDLVNRLLKFAGADHSLYWVRDGQLNEIEGDFFSIGEHSFGEENVFTCHELALEAGDQIYLFSDGFPDQFGGDSLPANGKTSATKAEQKFTLGRFEDLIQTISREAMENQQQSLNRAFDQWKGETRQVDDVLVIGLTV